MLGLQEDIISDYVETGQVKLVFWPVLNHGNASVYASVAMECVYQQDAQLGWDAHHDLFVNLSELWRADRDYFVAKSAEWGADQAAFETCYDDRAATDHVVALDIIRKERGIRGQPIFDVDGVILGGTSQLERSIANAVP